MERCGFFDAYLEGDEYDRVYLAQHFAAYFASFIANGVYAGHSSELQVMSMTTPQMQVAVESGQGWINGYWYENTDSLYLPVDVADGVLNRIDSVVLRLGFAERNMWLEVKKGTPAIDPVPPSVTRSADYYELQLATISVPASSIRITQAQITDTRMDNDVCGWVTGVIQQIDTTTLFEQFEAYFAEFKQVNESEFIAWFDSMKDQLSEDAAGHLQNQIGDLSDLLTPTKTDLVSALNEVVTQHVVVTLPASSWSNRAQTVNVSAVSSTNIIVVSSAPANLKVYDEAGIYCTGQGNGTLTFTCDKVPASNVNVNVLIIGG